MQIADVLQKRNSYCCEIRTTDAANTQGLRLSTPIHPVIGMNTIVYWGDTQGLIPFSLHVKLKFITRYSMGKYDGGRFDTLFPRTHNHEAPDWK